MMARTAAGRSCSRRRSPESGWYIGCPKASASTTATCRSTNDPATARRGADPPSNAARSHAATGRHAAWSAMTTCQPWTGTGERAAEAHIATKHQPA